MPICSAKSYPFFQAQTGRVGPQNPKTGPIGSTSKRVQHYNVLYKPDLDPTCFRVGPSVSKNRVESGWTSVSKFGINSGWIYLAALIPIPKLDLGFSFQYRNCVSVTVYYNLHCTVQTKLKKYTRQSLYVCNYMQVLFKIYVGVQNMYTRSSQVQFIFLQVQFLSFSVTNIF